MTVCARVFVAECLIGLAALACCPWRAHSLVGTRALRRTRWFLGAYASAVSVLAVLVFIFSPILGAVLVVPAFAAGAAAVLLRSTITGGLAAWLLGWAPFGAFALLLGSPGGGAGNRQLSPDLRRDCCLLAVGHLTTLLLAVALDACALRALTLSGDAEAR